MLLSDSGCDMSFMVKAGPVSWNAMEDTYTTAYPLLSSPHLVVSDVTSGDVWRVPGDIKRVGSDICQ